MIFLVINVLNRLSHGAIERYYRETTSAKLCNEIDKLLIEYREKEHIQYYNGLLEGRRIIERIGFRETLEKFKRSETEFGK